MKKTDITKSLLRTSSKSIKCIAAHVARTPNWPLLILSHDAQIYFFAMLMTFGGRIKKIAKTQYCYLSTLLINKPLEKARL